MDCAEVRFSPLQSEKRIHRAESFLGRKVVEKLLAFALHLLGAGQPAVSALLGLPEGSFHSLIRAVRLGGLPAFEDRRSRHSEFQPPPPRRLQPTLRRKKGSLVVDLGVGEAAIRIPADNRQQTRTVLLTLLDSGLLSRPQVAEALRLSQDRTGKLARRLARGDVAALLDQRAGQRREYRFNPQVKGELITQFVLDLAQRGNTSGRRLAAGLKERCGLELSPRSVQLHLSRLGLTEVKEALAERLAEAKKKSSGS